jgi:acyl-CoA synthetase (AMP-forming)/AMP-acid ligase II
MKVPLTVNDFLRRAELVYPERVAIVDEPDQPAESWGTITYREMAERARAMAAGLDQLGIGVGERVAMVSHNSARLLTALFGVSGSGRILVPVNFRLVAEEVKYIVAHSGARVLLIDPELADAMADVECEHKLIIGAEILRRVEEHGVTLMCGAPAVLNMVLDAAAGWEAETGRPVPGRDRVRIVVAGAPPPTRTIERCMTELGWEFVQIYGLTETTPLITMNRGRVEYDDLTPAEQAAKLNRAGAPVVGCTMAVNAEGEILARGNMVMDGYWEQPDQTDAAIHDGFFHTGDGGTIDDDNYVVISDRKKDVIITGGENVSSIEVEDAIFQHPEITEVAVIGIPDEKWGELVTALVVKVPGSALTEADVIAFAKTKLAGYKCPKRIEFRDELARTATGKLQKFKLREPFWSDATRQVH